MSRELAKVGALALLYWLALATVALWASQV